ncbi:4-alpha-D-glucan glucohydrolase) (Glucan 1, partial [Durusdinium trenchii]
EPPKIASDGVEVRFEVEKKTNHGEEVFVCGGTDALGNWDVRHARPLCCETTYPYWRAVIHFDSAEAGKTIAYKYLVQSSSQEPKWEDSPNRSLHLLELPRYRLQRLGTYLSPGEEGPEQDKTEEEDKAGIAVPGSFFGIAGKAASQSWVNKSFIDFEQKLHHIQDLAEKTQEQQKRLQSDYDNLLQKQLQTKELENLQRRQDSMDKHSEQSARELEELQRRQDSMDKEQSDRLQKLEEEVAKDVSQVRRQLHDLRTQRTGTSVKTQVAPPEALYKVKLEELLKETGLKQRLSKLESNNELSRIRFRLMSLEQRFHHAGTLQQKLGESHGVQSVKGRSVPLSTGQTLGRTLGRTCSPARNHAASCNGIMEHCPQLEALQQQMEGTTQAQASLQAQVAGEFAMYSQKIESLEAACAKHGREMAEAHTSFSEQQKFQDGTVQLIQDEVRYVQVIARKIDRVDCKADDLSTRMAAQKREFEGAHKSLKAQLESQAATVQEIQDEVSHAQEFAKKVDSKADELSTRFQRVDCVVQKIQDEVGQVQEIARKVDRVDCKADDLSTRVAAQKEEFEGAHTSLKAQLESQWLHRRRSLKELTTP